MWRPPTTGAPSRCAGRSRAGEAISHKWRAAVPRSSSDGLAPVLDWALDHLEVEHSVTDLARRARMSDRSFARRFVAETGTTPHRWLTLQRVLRAQRLLEDTDLGIDEVAERSGFGGGALLRHHFRKVVGVAPAGYRRTFTGRTAAVGT